VIDVLKEWVGYYNNKIETRRKFGREPLPVRPNSSKKAYDSNKLKKQLDKINDLFDNKTVEHYE